MARLKKVIFKKNMVSEISHGYYKTINSFTTKYDDKTYYKWMLLMDWSFILQIKCSILKTPFKESVFLIK